MNRVQPLTKRQRELYDYLVAYIHAAGFAPTLDEMRVALGLSSLATVHKHLSHLVERGYIRRHWNRSRSVTLLVGLGCCPMCGRELEKNVNEAKVSLEIGRKSDTMGSTSDASTSAVPTTTEVP